MYAKQAITKANNENNGNSASVDEQEEALESLSPENPVFRKIKLDKQGIYFSFRDNASKQVSKKKPVTRSKSFGNDFADSIPFIDCAEESNSGTESNIIYVREYKNAEIKTDSEIRTDSEIKTNGSEIPKNFLKDDFDPRYELSKSISCYYSDPGTPRTSSRLAQTDDSADSREGSTGKRTPKKKFPRLGTFERIKLENRCLQSTQSPKFIKPRTGTSAKHRRQVVTSTLSKEPLLKSDSVSPVQDTPQDISKTSTPEKSPKKSGKKGFFSRLFKKGSSNASSISSEMIEAGNIKEDLQADITEMKERKVSEDMEKVKPVLDEENDQPPPDYETTIKMAENVQVSFYFQMRDKNKVTIN